MYIIQRRFMYRSVPATSLTSLLATVSVFLRERNRHQGEAVKSEETSTIMFSFTSNHSPIRYLHQSCSHFDGSLTGISSLGSLLFQDFFPLHLIKSISCLFLGGANKTKNILNTNLICCKSLLIVRLK